jgi:hypothetical protein
MTVTNTAQEAYTNPFLEVRRQLNQISERLLELELKLADRNFLANWRKTMKKEAFELLDDFVQQLLTDYSREEIMSALELKLMAMKEETDEVDPEPENRI